jgi:hypothetical protein
MVTPAIVMWVTTSVYTTICQTDRSSKPPSMKDSTSWKVLLRKFIHAPKKMDGFNVAVLSAERSGEKGVITAGSRTPHFTRI